MIKSCAFILLILFGTIALAKDYGVSGHTFEIKEEGFLSMIYRKLQEIDLSEENKKMQQLAIKKVEQPTAVEGIKRAEKDQSFTFDPTYEVTEDIILPSSQVLYSIGTKVNPLEHVKLDKKLVFIDGKDRDQVRWFIKQVGEGNFKEEDKLILVNGRPLELGDKLQRQVYFDQAGVLTSRFKIEQVPAIVEQEGKLLRVKEICILAELK